MYVEAHPGCDQQDIIYWTRVHVLGNGYTRLRPCTDPVYKDRVQEIGLGRQRVGPLDCRL